MRCKIDEMTVQRLEVEIVKTCPGISEFLSLC